MNDKFCIIDILPEGKQNAMSSDALVRLLDLRSKRELQQLIAKERYEGALILSSSTGGYYTSQNRDEVAEFVRTLDNRARHTFAALKSARRFLKDADKSANNSCG